ncbi:CaiB/BaiF CoA transferase family protein [Achromobacter anxifer]|uniref:Acetyl-CoA:oxalate CoA-transferase n=1 Tax=Achromobacter anxifer TaxID=1287737 RepID=A0A6S7CHZ9_9BURK|nr:CoA transferase [Achromobacter anxifer]MDF8365054.1 CoA transferase [Achromobacter anxifer]CAB3832077.1 Acetyl-CoA:oxalate CoA-transferase [Achromobacter anxifer]CAB5513586.1 Acetyl-CoA:oxalate CoA-transferase [Achromobacter anxifer]
MSKVLDGITVIEQGTFITGPAAGMLLADLGADVIKVEQPGTGDPFRAFKGGLYSPHYQTYNRNKRSIEIDARKPDDAQVFDDLIREADVYIQNFRPGAAERLGAGEARLRALNPRLVYCAISGFGQTGPAAARPAYDSVAQAASGFLNLLVNPANPRVVGPAIADALTGFYAAYGILGALVERARTGVGRSVEVSMLEAMCHFNLDAFTHYFSEGEVMGPFSRPSVSQSYALACADGKKLALHMSSPEKFWRGLANAIERPDILQDARFATRAGRIAHHEELISVLGAVFALRTREEWCRRLAAEDVPHAPMYDTAEALQDPQARHLQLEIEGSHPTQGRWRTVRSPVSFDGQRASTVIPPPVLGEHNAEIRGALAARKPHPDTRDPS